ncbi:hypothetical protein O181_005739 [Austropuccinia psidii MF-1]|uniref:Uncharacterized protein n=1 Tax=Austropuccinia psidii MF-1 TaxID=1389203 RepID=A0A9Q3BIQ0_9BASI|nr:hypothetical protein [Austropuccinia psidii MF-1]
MAPFDLTPMKPKGGQGCQPSAPKARWAHLRQFWNPISTFPKMTQIGKEPQSGLWQPPEATSSSQACCSLHSGEGLSFTNVLGTKDSGMVHIWYNIPLCTNFAQKPNGDILRT